MGLHVGTPTGSRAHGFADHACDGQADANGGRGRARESPCTHSCPCCEGSTRADIQNTVLDFLNHVADSVHEAELARKSVGEGGGALPQRGKGEGPSSFRGYSRAYLDRLAEDAGVFDLGLVPGNVDDGWNPAWNRRVSEQQWRRAVCLFLQAYLLSTGSLEPHVVAKMETCREPVKPETSMHVYFSACVVPEILDCSLVGTWKDLAEDFFKPLYHRRDGGARQQQAPWHIQRFEEELRDLFRDCRYWSDLLESTEAFMMDNDLLDHTMMNLHLLVLFEVRNMMITQIMRLQVGVSTGEAAADVIDSFTATVERTDYRFMGCGQTKGTPAPPSSSEPSILHGAARDRASLLRLQQEMDLFWIGQSLPSSAGYEQAAFSPPPFPGIFVDSGPPSSVPISTPVGGDEDGASAAPRYLLEAFCLPGHEDLPIHEGAPSQQQQQRAERTGHAGCSGGGGALGIFTYTCTSPWIEFSSLLAHMSAAMLRGCIASHTDALPRPLMWGGMQLHTTCILRLENDSGVSVEVFRGMCVTERKLAWEADCAENRLKALMLSYKGKMAYLRNVHSLFKHSDLVHHIALQACGRGPGSGGLSATRRRLFPHAVSCM